MTSRRFPVSAPLLSGSLVAAFLAVAGAHAADLTITVTDLRSVKGAVGFSVVNSTAAWDGKAAAVERRMVPVSGNEVTLQLTDLPAGEYAVSVMHDENGNGELDANFMGMPTEGYGFSNNPNVLRKPTYDEARFQLAAEGGTITIRLR